MDAGNMVKPALARGELHVVGATTLEEYRKNIEKDAALARRFQPILIPEPTAEDTLAILHGLKDRYEAHHQVRYEDAALGAAVDLSDRYITDRFLPDKAIDLIDQAGARVRLRTKTPGVDRRELERKAEELRRDRDQAVASEDYEQASRLRDELRDIRDRAEELGRDSGAAVPEVTPDDVAEVVSRAAGCSASRSTCTTAWSARIRRWLRWPRRSAGPGPGSATRTARWAASCSSGRPASARPSWPAR
jgi:ATP-dependent Clp protease ATP-binding subunit ClpC